MRPDMAKVVTERPRSGARLKAPKGEKRRRDWEAKHECESKGESIRGKWLRFGWDNKEFTDVLGPLYGYLLKQVGRPWSKVYSEICQHLPANSNQGSHIRGHIFDFVEVNVVMVDGEPWDSTLRYRVAAYGLPGSNGSFFVNPDSGLLCRTKENKYPRLPKRKPLGIPVPGTKNRQYHKIDGVWYELTLKSVAKPKVDSFVAYSYWVQHKKPHPGLRVERHYDLAYKRELSPDERRSIYGSDSIAVGKKQLNSKEIKKAGLR